MRVVRQDAAVARSQDDGQSWILFTDDIGQFDAVRARHDHVREHQVKREFVFGQDRDRLSRGPCPLGGVAEILQKLSGEFADVWIVLDDQNAVSLASRRVRVVRFRLTAIFLPPITIDIASP